MSDPADAPATPAPDPFAALAASTAALRERRQAVESARATVRTFADAADYALQFGAGALVANGVPAPIAAIAEALAEQAKEAVAGRLGAAAKERGA